MHCRSALLSCQIVKASAGCRAWVLSLQCIRAASRMQNIGREASMHPIRKLAALILVIAFTPAISRAADQHDPVYMGKPFSYWMESLRNRDEEMQLAFAAINALGPDAASAVPELVRILSEPFAA